MSKTSTAERAEPSEAEPAEPEPAEPGRRGA